MSTFAPFLDQDFNKLKADLLEKGELFTDPKFGPQDSSLFKFRKQYTVQWKRAKEIYPNAEFIVNGISPNDLDQGQLGDCWLISSFAAVAEIPEYINKVVPTDQSFNDGDYCGMFHFRIWRNGYWIDVVVDDYLPVSGDNLAFCRNEKDKNEMWGSLLEKAFAKVNASYEFIGNGGHPTDALVDLTGGVHETYELQDNKKTNKKANIKKKALWDLLVKGTSVKSLMGASIDDYEGKTEQKTKTGLITGHAYSILGSVEIFSNDGKFDQIAKMRERTEPIQANSIKLLKVRNPWGRDKEWNGAFSETSNSWDQVADNVKSELKVTEQDDGNFYISLEDFLKNFHRVHFVHVNLSGLSHSEVGEQDSNEYHWNATAFSGEWQKGVNSGGCGNDGWEHYWKNPQYNIHLKLENSVDDKVSVIIDLMQCELVKRRLTRGRKEEAIAFTIYRVRDKDGLSQHKIEKGKKFTEDQLEEVGTYGTYMFIRQVCKRFNLPAGDYVIIPSCFHKDVDMKYLMRVYTEGNLGSSVVVSNLNKQKKGPSDDVVIPAKEEPEVPADEASNTEEEKPDVHVEKKWVEPEGDVPDVIGQDVDISDEQVTALEEEWRQLEEDWLKISQNRSEDDPYYVRPSKEMESYESDTDEYRFEEEPAVDDEVSGVLDHDIWYLYGSDSEFEYEDIEKRAEEKKQKVEQRIKLEKQNRKNGNKKESGFGQKIINVIFDEVDDQKEKVSNKSKACSIM